MLPTTKLEGKIMVRAKKPVKPAPPSLKLYCASFLIAWIPRIVVGILIVSFYHSAIEYYSILNGNNPTELQKIVLDYSLSILAGSAAFLLIYAFEMKKIVHHLLDIKEREPITLEE